MLLPCLAGRYYIDLGVLVLTYVMLGWGLNIVVGLAGLLDLGYVAFYAVGAYSYALLSTSFGLGFWTCLPLAGLLAAAWGMLLGFPVLRLRGDYLAIVTLAFGEIIRIVLINWRSLTNGRERHPDIPRPTLFGLVFDSSGGPGTFAGYFGLDYSPTQRRTFLYYVILGLALLTNWVDPAPAPAAAGPRLGGAAGGRDRLPLAGHQRDGDQADGVRHRRHVRRLRRRVLRHPAGLRQPGKLHLHRIGDRAGDRGAGRARQPAGRGAGGAGDDRRAGALRLPVLTFSPGSGSAGDWQYRMLIFGLALVIMMILRPRGLVAGRTPTVALAGKPRQIAADLVAHGRG